MRNEEAQTRTAVEREQGGTFLGASIAAILSRLMRRYHKKCKAKGYVYCS
jgi:molybdenum-dependent DNA-binding transcriptional regulator ModE